MKFLRIPLLLVALLSTLMVKAQDLNMNANESELAEFGIPSMGECIYLAIQNSPALEVFDFEVKKQTAELYRMKADWMKYLYVDANAGYQNIPFAQSLDPTAGVMPTTIGESFVYRVGGGVRLSLYEVLGKSRERQIIRLEIEGVKKSKGQVIKDLEIRVIEAYKNLVYAHSASKIMGQNFRDVDTNRSIAEKQFLDGVITINEFAEYEQIASTAQLEYQRARTEFEKALFILQSIIGHKIIK